MGNNAFKHSRIHALSLLLALPALLALLSSCGDTHREFRSADGTVVASCSYPGTDSLHAVWQFTDKEGRPLVPGCDSVRVVELGPDGHPMTVCFHKGGEECWRQYYSTMQLRSEGSTIDGRREGHWVFYFPNGNKQSECTFVSGLEEGPYRVYRESGAPYYVGQCREGRYVGTWEIYDENGSLAGTKEYGD